MLGQGLRKSIDPIIDSRKVTTTRSHSLALRPLHVNSRMSHFVSRSSCSSARPHLCVCVGKQRRGEHQLPHTHTRPESSFISQSSSSSAGCSRFDLPHHICTNQSRSSPLPDKHYLQISAIKACPISKAFFNATADHFNGPQCQQDEFSYAIAYFLQVLSHWITKDGWVLAMWKLSTPHDHLFECWRLNGRNI